MKQLTMKDLELMVNDLKRRGVKLEDVQVYLGNDDELNGIHTAWFLNEVDASNKKDEDNLYYLEMINEDAHNVELKNGIGIVIS